VATALLYGAESVDAVEIDPVIASLGSEHPGRPYSDARVRVIVDDGRAFMTRTEKKYDLIIFALTDSLVKVSSMGQLRLENYLFTEESIRRAYDLLEPEGDIVLYNYYRREWLVDRYREMLHEATGRRLADGKILDAQTQSALQTHGATAGGGRKPPNGRRFIVRMIL